MDRGSTKTDQSIGVTAQGRSHQRNLPRRLPAGLPAVSVSASRFLAFSDPFRSPFFRFLSRIGATLAGLMADKPLIVSDLRD